MKQIQRSIIRKLLNFFSLYNVIAIAIFLGILVFSVQPKMQEQSSIEAQLTADNIITKLRLELNKAESLAQSMAIVAQGFSDNETLDKGMMLALLKQAENNDYIAGGGVWPEPFMYDKTKERASFFWGKNINGNFVFFDDYNAPEGMGYHHENWYVPSKYTAKQRAFWSQSYIDAYSKVPMVTVSVPIYKDNTFLGVVTVDVSLEGLNKLFIKETEAFGGYAFLIDRDGKVLSNPNGKFTTMKELTDFFPQYLEVNTRIIEYMKEDLLDTENTELNQNIQKEVHGITQSESGRITSIINGLEHKLTQYEEFVFEDEIVGGKAQACLIEIKDLHWKLIVVMPEEYIFGKISSIYDIALVSIFLIMGVLYILSLLTFKKVIVKPIKKISDELLLIMDANNSRKYLSEEGSDEFTYLAEQFNKQTSLLHQAQDKLLSMNMLVVKEVELKTRSLEEEKETFETLFNDTTDGMILLKYHHFVKCNNAVVKLFKHRSKQSLLAAHPMSFSPKHQPDGSLSAVKARAILRKVLAEGSYSFEWTYLQTDGNKIPCQVTLTKIFIEGESIIHAIVKDITVQVHMQKEMEHKNSEYKKLAETLEDQVEERTEDLAYAIRVKSDFLANMSHEVRTPMTAILGFIDILRKSEKDHTKLEQFGLITESGKTLLSVINDILDFSKIESGKLCIENEVFVTRAPFIEIIELYQEKANEKSISVLLNLDENLPIKAKGDVLRIKQVATNLLSNAIKFTPEKGEIEINIFYDSKNNWLRFAVEDNGIGIKEESIAKIFKAFEQVDVSTTRRYGGTGLGLAISADLVKLMEGDIIVSSVENEGTRFEVMLPVFKENFDDVEVLTSSDKNEEEIQQYIANILVVEDNKANQMLMKLLLLDRGIICDIAEDGEVAVQECKNREYDLILMDENMPNMNGIEATRVIRENEASEGKHTPIVAVTANALKGDKERFLEAGMDDYLSKPLANKALDGILARYLTTGNL